MNTEKMKTEVATIEAQMNVLAPIIEEVRKQEQEIVAHRVKLGVQMTELKKRLEFLTEYLKEVEENQ